MISNARRQAARSRDYAKLVGQPDYPETGPIALFRVLAVTHHDFSEDGDVRPDAGSLRRYALRPILAELVIRWQMITLCRVLSVTGGDHLGCDILSYLPEIGQ